MLRGKAVPENNEQQTAANQMLKNIDELEQNMQQQIKQENKQAEQGSAQKPTLFMLNNNAPQPNQNTEQSISINEVESYYKQNFHTRSYGITAIVLSVVALLCSIILIIAISTGITSENASGFLLWVFNFILVPVLGIAGSVIFGILGAIFGIVAISKAHKRIVSWVGFVFGLIILAYVVVMAGVYLFT